MSGRTYDDDRDQDLDKIKNSKKSKTPLLDNFGRDLTALARNEKLDPVIGREVEVEKAVQILSKRKKNNAILVGDPGVGKTAIAEGLAIRIATRQIDSSFFDKRIVELNMMSIVAGTKYRGQFEERMEDIIKEVMDNPDVILFIDEFHNVIGAGNSSGALDASNIIKPPLARGDLRVIASTTLDEYKKFIEKDGALARRFQKILVTTPTKEETLEILKQIKGKYETHHRVSYSDAVLKKCIDLADRYMTYRNNPDKSIDLLDEVGAKVKLLNKIEQPENITILEKELEELIKEKKAAVSKQDFESAARFKDKQNKLEGKIAEEKENWNKELQEKGSIGVTEEDVAFIVASHTGIPVNKLSSSENERLLKMEDTLRKKVIGQAAAVEKVAKAIQRSRVGIQDPSRPIGSFLFLGSTGVGKTELTKVLAQYLFDDEKSLIRLDMSEYMDKFNVSKMIGSPPGYVGYEEGGSLTEQVKNRPHSIILFDEIEKAHPDVWNIMLQILDDGKLTDSFGREIDFKNTIIIMTSNIGTSKIIEERGVGFSTGAETTFAVEDLVMEELQKRFKPEFINRIDEIVVFSSLKKEDVRQIVDVQLDILIKRMKNSDNYTITVTEAAKDYLAEIGYDKKYGARPLKRAIINHVQNNVANAILTGAVVPGDIVEVGFDQENKKIVVKKGNG